MIDMIVTKFSQQFNNQHHQQLSKLIIQTTLTTWFLKWTTHHLKLFNLIDLNHILDMIRMRMGIKLGLLTIVSLYLCRFNHRKAIKN